MPHSQLTAVQELLKTMTKTHFSIHHDSQPRHALYASTHNITHTRISLIHHPYTHEFKPATVLISPPPVYTCSHTQTHKQINIWRDLHISFSAEMYRKQVETKRAFSTTDLINFVPINQHPFSPKLTERAPCLYTSKFMLLLPRSELV